LIAPANESKAGKINSLENTKLFDVNEQNPAIKHKPTFEGFFVTTIPETKTKMCSGNRSKRSNALDLSPFDMSVFNDARVQL
jgi:hypothetical protein